MGGKIVVGVKDDGSICGLDEPTIEKHLELFNKVIYECCSPPIIAKVYPRHIGLFTVLEIDISEGMMKPYFICCLSGASSLQRSRCEKITGKISSVVAYRT